MRNATWSDCWKVHQDELTLHTTMSRRHLTQPNQLIIDTSGFLFALHGRTKHGTRRCEDSAFYIAQVRALLDLLRGAFGHVHIVFDGLKVDRDDIQAKRCADMAGNYAKQTERLQMYDYANTDEVKQVMPLSLSTCLYAALKNYARQHADEVTLHWSRDEADTAAARLAQDFAAQQPAGARPPIILSRDSDLFFLQNCTAMDLKRVKLNTSKRKITMGIGISWEERCKLLLGDDIDPASEAASLFMGLLAVVLGNDRIPEDTFGELGPRREGQPLTVDGIQNWLAKQRRGLQGGPQELLESLLEKLPLSPGVSRDTIRRAVQWYQPGELQLPDLRQLADDSEAMLTALDKKELPLLFLGLAVHHTYSVRCLYQPHAYKSASGERVQRGAWAYHSGLVRLEFLLCHLFVEFSDWLKQQGWHEAAGRFDEAHITCTAKTASGIVEATVEMPVILKSFRLDDRFGQLRRNFNQLRQLSLPRAALAVVRGLGSDRVPEFAHYERALCRLVALAENLPSAHAPCSCVALGQPERVPGELLSLFDTWACCLELLLSLDELLSRKEKRLFQGVPPDEQALCVLYDPITLLRLAEDDVACKVHAPVDIENIDVFPPDLTRDGPYLAWARPGQRDQPAAAGQAGSVRAHSSAAASAAPPRHFAPRRLCDKGPVRFNKPGRLNKPGSSFNKPGSFNEPGSFSESRADCDSNWRHK